ncbi:MAG: zinc-ribbon domain-containing protein [Pyrinomonadaceae bacterium]
MFCPKCATQNLDGASFCRSCGANISLIPQALSGLLPTQVKDSLAPEWGHRRRRRNRELSLDQSFKNIFMGIAFLIVAIALSRSIGAGWWFWMLIPAFSMMGTGVAQFIRLSEKKRTQSFSIPVAPTAVYSLPKPVGTARNTGELISPPPSVTEGTTRHLGVDAATRQLDPTGEQK